DRQAPDALVILMRQRERGKDPLQLLTGLLRHVRNLLVVASIQQASAREDAVAQLVDEPQDRLKRLETQAQHTTPQELLLFLQVLTGAYEMVRRSPLAQTILELVVMKLATREQWQSLEQIAHHLERIGPGMMRPDALPGDLVGARAPQAVAGQEPSGARSSASPSENVPISPAQAAAQESASASLEAITTIWPSFLERLGAKKMSLAAYLAEAKLLQLDGRVLMVGLPGFALHQEMLNLAENRRLIEGLLGESAQQPITVQYATRPEPVPGTPPATLPSSASPTVPPLVQDIVNLFNATVLEPPRTTG
ncbi:MAG: hypothetical protein HYZ91_00785, partial [Candidatus Omnitrophica bacterium]|nr:hypothetical protein [Candidatus Omnitrophota bacterium]